MAVTGAADSCRLLLFVRGQARPSQAAIRAVRRACSGAKAPKLTVLDVFNEPAMVEKYRVIATPTLVAIEGAVEWRLVGEVSEQSVRDRFGSEAHGH